MLKVQESCAIAKMTAQCALKLNAQSFPKTGNPKNVENLTTFTKIRMDRELDSSALNLA